MREKKNCVPAVHFAWPVASPFPVPEISPLILRNIWKVHKTVSLVAVIPESREGRGGKRTRSTEDDEDVMQRDSKRQTTLQRKVSPVVIRRLVAEYIIDDMLPL